MVEPFDSMDEVSWKAFEFYSDYLTRRGVDRRRLVEGIPRGAALLAGDRKWYDWDEHVVICERFGDLCGGWDAAESAAGSASLESWTRPLRTVARNFASARHIYWLGAHLFGPNLYRHIRFDFEELARHHVRISIVLPAQYEACELVFRMWRGAFRAAPRMLGLDDAQVDADITGHRGTYSIWLPQNRSLTRKAAFAARSLFSRKQLIGELREEYDQLRDSFEALARAYKDSESRQRALVAAMPDVILCVSSDGSIMSIDGATDSPLRANLSGSSDAAFRTELARHARLAIEGAPGLVFQFDIPDGETSQSYECRTVKVGNETALSVVRDVTAQRRLERQLRVAETLASLGTLAASVAHEINNPLTYMFANLERLQKGLQRGTLELDEVRDVARFVVDAAERIRDVVRGVKAFTKPDPAPPTPVDVNRAVESALRIAEHRLRPRAEVTLHLGEGAVARASAGPLEQVLVNLLVNAAEAFPPDRSTTGHVSVTTQRLSGGWIAVDVTDDGQGVPKELQARIFDPFFTTKVTGSGTGLGLAISHGIVMRFGGQITVESAPGRGATFRVILPAAELPRIPTSEAPRPATIALRPAAGVLIVDDETAILNVLRLMLDDHVVLTASSGAAGLRVVHDEDIKAVVCDLSMPEMTGIEFARQLREVRPRLLSRLIFMTGDAASWAEDLATIPHAGCIEKPFTEAAFRSLLSQVVGGSADVDQENPRSPRA